MTFEIWDIQDIDQNIPWVRLSQSTLVISKSLKDALKTDNIQLAYDKKLKTIRIKSVGNDEPGIKMLKTKINARKFFEYFNIEQLGKFEARFDEKENAFMVKIG
ncbi:MAG TPA: hypothetical protein DCY71_01680 [Clostridiaceae bacterium]|jgi:hypothetical protein|nr:hypothetical protein [Clostridiaceae bacterium]